MGGATVATAVDLVIPGYSRIIFAGIGASMPEGPKRTGVRAGIRKTYEVIGKAEWKLLTSPKYLGRFGARAVATRAGARVIPVIGWMLLAYDGIQLGMAVRSRTHQMLKEKRGYGLLGGPDDLDSNSWDPRWFLA